MSLVERWLQVSADPSIKAVDPANGASLWRGPTGSGIVWTTDMTVPLDIRGCVWTSDLGEISDSRNGDHDRFFWHTGMACESTALAAGWYLDYPPVEPASE